MKLKRRSKIINFCLFFLVLFYFTNKKEKVKVNNIDNHKIKDFDLIISKGQSAQSKFIGLLNYSIEDYSHIGIIKKKGDSIFVLHSTPDGTETNGIRFDNLQKFLDLSDVNDYTVLRFQNISNRFHYNLNVEFEKLKKGQAPFDYDFNNFDHGKIYCSELVCIILKNSRLSTLQEFDMSKPIYPKYFFKVKGFVKINTKKISQ
ncbi:MAG: YiiX/YebB-like N1pC/P60 family cysteine hydrolase [Bacteroidota bacterium]